VETLQVSRIAPGLAASLLQGLERLDPRGTTAPEDLHHLTTSGQCFAAAADTGQAVYVVKVSNGVAWVSACKGGGPVKWREVLLPIIEQQAAGCDAVAFQTARRGLVKAAKRQGYEVTGWIMKKKLQ
jgi:hypothetical protein